MSGINRNAHLLRDTLILPTQFHVDMLVVELSSMSVADYDLMELISNACVAMFSVHEIEQRINQFYQMYARWDLHRAVTIQRGPNSQLHTKVIPDGVVISNAWLKFTKELFNIYKQIGLWDPSGVTPYCFHSLQGRDIVVRVYPT